MELQKLGQAIRSYLKLDKMSIKINFTFLEFVTKFKNVSKLTYNFYKEYFWER